MQEVASRSIFDTPLEQIDLPELITISENLTLVEVLHELQKMKIGAIGISQGSELVGIFSERDFLIRIVNQIQDWKEKIIKDFMTLKPLTLKSSNTLKDAIVLMIRRDFRHIPVYFDKDSKWKIISAKDVLKVLVNQFPESLNKYGVKTTWSVMELDAFGENFSFSESDDNEQLSENSFLMPLRRAIFRKPLIVDREESLAQVLSKMQQTRQAAAIVTKYQTEVEGIITERDFLFKIFDKIELTEQTLVSQFMTKEPHTLLSRHFICFAINNMFKFNYRNLIIVNEDRNPLATVTLMDILKVLTWNLISKA